MLPACRHSLWGERCVWSIFAAEIWMTLLSTLQWITWSDSEMMLWYWNRHCRDLKSACQQHQYQTANFSAERTHWAWQMKMHQMRWAAAAACQQCEDSQDKTLFSDWDHQDSHCCWAHCFENHSQDDRECEAVQEPWWDQNHNEESDQWTERLLFIWSVKCRVQAVIILD